MFNLTCILEDNQIVLTRKGNLWKGTICDGHSGLEVEVEVTDEELSSILAVAIDTNGKPYGVEKHYEFLAGFLKRYGMEEGGANEACRPIP